MRAASGVWVAVPLKRMDRGKERLSDLLSANERRRLVEAMARDVLQALFGVPVAAEHILLVSDDPVVAALATECGVRCFAPPPARNDPLNEDLAEAARYVIANGAHDLLIVHADLPLAGPAQLRALIEDHRERHGRRVTLVPDRAGEGTNCLLCTPPDAVAFRFGQDSRRRHLAACREGGVDCVEHRCEALGADVDHPQDFAELVQASQSTQNVCGANTRALLREIGAAAILERRGSRRA